MDITRQLPRIRELLDAGNLPEAVATFENLLRSNEGQGRGKDGFETENLYPLYCSLCMQMDKSDIPLTWLEKASAVDAALNDRFLSFIRELLRKDKIKEADEIGKKLCLLDPENPKNWLSRAAFYVRTQRVAEADACFQRALSQTRDDPETYLRIAGVYVEEGLPERAGTLLCTLMRRGNRTPQIIDVLFRLHEKKLLSPQDSSTVSDLARERGAKVHLNLAWLRYAEGDHAGAARLFSKGIELDGSNPRDHTRSEAGRDRTPWAFEP